MKLFVALSALLVVVSGAPQLGSSYAPAPLPPPPPPVYRPAPLPPPPPPAYAPAPIPAYGPAPIEVYPDVPPAYDYGYAVQDSYSGVDFAANENRNGYTTNGQYRVALPDGRIQIVTYSVPDALSGYIADVKYEGTPIPYAAPAPIPVRPAYGPAPIPVTAPLPAPAPIPIGPAYSG